MPSSRTSGRISASGSRVQRGGPSFGQADVTDLPLLDQLAQRAHGVLDRCLRVDPMLVIQIDVIGAQALERSLDRGPDILRGAVDFPAATMAMGDQSELGGEDDLFAVPGGGGRQCC